MISNFFDMTLADVPYASSEAHLLDLARLCDMRIDLYYDIFIDNEKQRALTDVSVDENHEEILGFISSCEAYIEGRRKKALTAGVFLPIEYIRYVFELDEFEYFTLVAALMPYMSIEFERKYAILNNHKEIGHPFLETCSKLYFLQNSLGGNMMRHKQFCNNKVRFLFERRYDELATSWLGYPLKLSEQIAYFILGVHNEAQRVGYTCHYPETELERLSPSLEVYRGKVERFIDAYEGSVLLVTSRRGIGKKHILKTIAKSREMPLLTVEWRDYKEDENGIGVFDVVRQYIIDQSIVCIDEVTAIDAQLVSFVKTLHRLGATVIMTSTNQAIHWQNTDIQLIRLHIELPSVLENQAMWQDAAAAHIQEGTLDIPWLCNRFRFTYGDIDTIVQRALEKSLLEIETLEKPVLVDWIVKEEAKAHFKEHLNGLVIPVKPMFSWEDLVIGLSGEQMLKSACHRVKYKDIVYEKYGLGERVAYGKGINVLLKGPPGTGKTMAAQVMANYLDMALYKVDLSQLVSKYIGETEKNIQTIFSACENSNIILFFDEMDALFSKRTEVSDANDRHANLEIAYLLQSLEAYEGVVIMATNYVENIDEAFMRRIQYIVDFPLPTKEQRLKILKGMLSKDIPLSEDLDCGVIEPFDLSGGEIKNIVVASVYSAVHEDSPVTTRHLVQSIKNEIEKQGKLISNSDFGKYRIYLEV